MKHIHGNDYLEAKELVKQLQQKGWEAQDLKTQSYGGSDVFISCQMTHPEYSEFILSVYFDSIELGQIDEMEKLIPVLIVKNRSVNYCIDMIHGLVN